MNFSEAILLSGYNYRSTSPFLIDVGAHHGDVSLMFAKKGWHIIAFEPEKKNRAAFERNLSGFNHVSCVAKAVSDVSGEHVPFYVSDEHYGIHTLKPFHKTHKFAYDVETVRLDDFLRELKVSEVTLLKIDVEGADFLALKGFDFERYNPELIMVEFMDERSLPNFEYTHHDMAIFMKKNGYTTFVSEWSPIKEYGREGIRTEPHIWFQCAPYPLGHEPAWGNLIFVPNYDVDKFSSTLNRYLTKLKYMDKIERLKSGIGIIPGSKKIYRASKKVLSFFAD